RRRPPSVLEIVVVEMDRRVLFRSNLEVELASTPEVPRDCTARLRHHFGVVAAGDVDQRRPGDGTTEVPGSDWRRNEIPRGRSSAQQLKVALCESSREECRALELPVEDVFWPVVSKRGGEQHAGV